MTAIFRPAAFTFCAMRTDALIVSAIGFSQSTSTPCANATSITASWRPGGTTIVQKSAAFSVRNPHTDATLFIEYDARPDLFAGASQQVTVFAGDQAVKTFAADSSKSVLLRIPITAAQLGPNDMTDLRLELDKTFVPAKLPAGGRDERELGIRVYHLFVEGR